VEKMEGQAGDNWVAPELVKIACLHSEQVPVEVEVADRLYPQVDQKVEEPALALLLEQAPQPFLSNTPL
jgi:hypothetical protein